MPVGGTKLIGDFWKAQALRALVIPDTQVHCSNSELRRDAEGWKGQTQVCPNIPFSIIVHVQRASSSSWSHLLAEEEASGFLGFIQGKWLDVGMLGVGGIGKGFSLLIRDCSGSWHSNQSLQASTTWHLSRLSLRNKWLWFGTKGLPFPQGKAREVPTLNREHLCLHWPSSASELGVSKEVEMGWKGKWSDDRCWLRGLGFILGPVKSHKWVLSEAMKNLDCALKRSLGSWLRAGAHFQNTRTFLIATSPSTHTENHLWQCHTMWN